MHTKEIIVRYMKASENHTIKRYMYVCINACKILIPRGVLVMTSGGLMRLLTIEVKILWLSR